MQLSKVAKDVLRKRIEEQLKDVPEGQRIQLDKDLLEDLLFEVVTVNKEKDIKVKLPVWSGEFLQKVDLSQVDFTNVSWYILGCPRLYVGDSGIIDDVVIEILNKVKNDGIEERKKRGNGYVVSYKGTNAHIDLRQSFEAIHENVISIEGCNFLGLDFSSHDLIDFKNVWVCYSDISETKLPIPNNISFNASGSYLRGIDLSDRTIDGFEYFMGDTSHLTDCVLTNSCIKIKLNAEDFKEFKFYDELHQAMNYDWVGCYVNGKKVLSSDEKKAMATEKKEEYEKMKAEIFNSVLGSIEEQKKPKSK